MKPNHGDSCQPLSLTRRIEDFPIGNIALSQHRKQWPHAGGITVNPLAWLHPHDWATFVSSGDSTLTAPDGSALAWRENPTDASCARVARHSFLIRHAWDLLAANESHLATLADHRIEGDVHPSAVIEGILHAGPGTRILPGVFIEGHVVIGANCKVGPNCHIRGHTSIGDRCHIGQAVEIKNSILLSGTNVGHLSYVGDSILGEGVNFGAGTIVSNLRHDGKNHRSLIDGQLVDTGRRKLGCIVGDGVHTGIHTAIYPGRKLWPGTTTRPGEIVGKDIIS